MGEEGPGGTVHLLCLAASSGVPLFCRSSRGGAPTRQQVLVVGLEELTNIRNVERLKKELRATYGLIDSF
uniref:Fuzzy planar cell polarity protein n=1 Tax=Nannospalax galili TaxID=1026970 RepID=A0A8C6WBT9_NANGA